MAVTRTRNPNTPAVCKQYEGCAGQAMAVLDACASESLQNRISADVEAEGGNNGVVSVWEDRDRAVGKMRMGHRNGRTEKGRESQRRRLERGKGNRLPCVSSKTAREGKGKRTNERKVGVIMREKKREAYEMRWRQTGQLGGVGSSKRRRARPHLSKSKDLRR